ncbi:MAG: hypothetical protein M3327_08950 [Actinomycetota bacterium]|nr:hypothetical protein [Actinomycetota bacterium]
MFPAVEFPVIQPDPEVGDGWVRFVQTVGGRVAGPAPHPLPGEPYPLIAKPGVAITRRRLGPGETLIERGNPGDDLFVVLAGALDVEVDGRTTGSSVPARWSESGPSSKAERVRRRFAPARTRAWACSLLTTSTEPSLSPSRPRVADKQ